MKTSVEAGFFRPVASIVSNSVASDFILALRSRYLHPISKAAGDPEYPALTLCSPLALQSFSAALELAKGFEPPTL